MKKKYIIRKNEEIQEIVKTSKKLVNKYFIVYFRKNDFQYNRYYENPREINTMLTNEVYVKAPTSFDKVGGNVNLENSL